MQHVEMIGAVDDETRRYANHRRPHEYVVHGALRIPEHPGQRRPAGADHDLQHHETRKPELAARATSALATSRR